MEFVAVEVYLPHLLVCYFTPCWVFPAIQPAGHFQAFGRARFGDELDYLHSLNLKIAVPQQRREKCSYQQLALSCGLSASDAHAAVKRACLSRLLNLQLPAWVGKDYPIGNYVANTAALIEFSCHGLRYVWPAKDGPSRLGVPTGLAVVAEELDMVRGGEPHVWPSPDGTVQGVLLEPWHPALPLSCLQDPGLHRLAAIIEVIRTGGARAAAQARKALERRLSASNIRAVAS